jgi:citrate synthase
MSEVAKLIFDDKEVEIPIVVGTENERGLDISKLRAQTGLVTLDEGFVNTASTSSSITYLEGENGVLRYRGYPIEQLAADADFIEVAYLLMHGDLPTRSQLTTAQGEMRQGRSIPSGVADLIASFPTHAHPMAMLAAAVVALSDYYTDSLDPFAEEEITTASRRLLAQLPTIAAYAYRRSMDKEFVEPREDLDYCHNFLRMMFGEAGETQYDVDPVLSNALDMLLIVHADHEQNCSTSTVRMVGSSDANIYASIAGGICALWGPLHGGANEAVVNMLEQIQADNNDVDKYVDMAKDKSNHFRLMGFGHRVYKSYDPRAKIVKAACDKVLDKLNIDDPLLAIAKKLEKVATTDEYFLERNLYPNVDFFSGVLYRAIGIPSNMFTAMFALGRLPGWLSHWIEMRGSENKRIARPRQIYTGATQRDFVPLDKR